MATNGSISAQNGTEDADTICKYAWDLKQESHVIRDIERNTKVQPDILHVIGNTPLVKLNKITKAEGIKCDMYAKCEFLNPGGSVKDRIGYRMVLDAERDGIISVEKKSVLIEPTSGNTGIGIALAAAIRGYRCIIVLPEKMSDEKVNTLAALGAEIIRTPTEAAWDDPASNISVAQRLSKEIANAVVLDQYKNAGNPLAHYDGTGEEILWSLDDDVDMVVLGSGTGGTITGVGRKIKERCPKCVVVAADPYGSILAIPSKLNHTDLTMYEVEGIGYDFIPKVLDRSVVDRWIKTEDTASLQLARRLIKEEGLLCGGSSGSALYAALEAARDLKEGQKCVVILPDGVRNYMTKFFSDQWMEARRLKDVPDRPDIWWWNLPVSTLPAVAPPTISPHTSTSEALQLLKKHNVASLPVLNENKSIMGVFTSDNFRRRVSNHAASPSDPVEHFLVKKYYKAKTTDKMALLSRMLDIAPFVVIVSTSDNSVTETPVGIVDSLDLMNFANTAAKQKNGN